MIAAGSSKAGGWRSIGLLDAQSRRGPYLHSNGLLSKTGSRTPDSVEGAPIKFCVGAFQSGSRTDRREVSKLISAILFQYITRNFHEAGSIANTVLPLSRQCS